MRGNLLLVTRSTIANAQVPRAESPGQIGRKKTGAVMGQFSGGCYLSLGIVVFLCLQFPTTLARGKNSLKGDFFLIDQQCLLLCCARAGICSKVVRVCFMTSNCTRLNFAIIYFILSAF